MRSRSQLHSQNELSLFLISNQVQCQIVFIIRLIISTDDPFSTSTFIVLIFLDLGGWSILRDKSIVQKHGVKCRPFVPKLALHAPSQWKICCSCTAESSSDSAEFKVTTKYVKCMFMDRVNLVFNHELERV